MSAAAASPARRVFVITGSNTGVGVQSAMQIALGDTANERHVILACRTASKAQAAVEKILAALPPGRTTRVEFMRLDLTDLNTIKAFAEEFQRRRLPLHVLINNAGVNTSPPLAQQSLDLDGQWVANYFGHWVLTRLLLPVLEASAPSRIINVTSFMHRLGSTDFARQCRLTDHRSYSTSKLAQILHAHELHRRYASKGITVAVSHPGACNSDIWNTLEPKCFRAIMQPLARALMLTTAQGAAPSVHAATKELTDESAREGVEHWGPYASIGGIEFLCDAWQPSRFSRVTKSRTSAVSYNEKLGAELWQLSEELLEEWEEAAKRDGQK